MNNYTVYCLTNTVNGKRYIGITNNFRRRWLDHQRHDYVIGRALRKHGKESFRISVLYSRLSFEMAAELEKRLILEMDTIMPNGYNVASGGGGGNTIAGFTDEEMEVYKQKQREANLGKELSDETKRKIGKASKGNKYNLGRKLTDEHKRKIGEAGKGRVVSDETRVKFSEIHKGKIIPSEMRCRISESLKGRKRPELSGDKNPMSTANRDKRRGQLRLFD